jgi:hypothetical protein
MPIRRPMRRMLGDRMNVSSFCELRAPAMLFRPPLCCCFVLGLTSFDVAQRRSGRTIIGSEGEYLTPVFLSVTGSPLALRLRVLRFSRWSQAGMRTLGFGGRSRGSMFGRRGFLGCQRRDFRRCGAGRV